jgi:hypothetical protein
MISRIDWHRRAGCQLVADDRASEAYEARIVLRARRRFGQCWLSRVHRRHLVVSYDPCMSWEECH